MHTHTQSSLCLIVTVFNYMTWLTCNSLSKQQAVTTPYFFVATLTHIDVCTQTVIDRLENHLILVSARSTSLGDIEQGSGAGVAGV